LGSRAAGIASLALYCFDVTQTTRFALCPQSITPPSSLSAAERQPGCSRLIRLLWARCTRQDRQRLPAYPFRLTGQLHGSWGERRALCGQNVTTLHAARPLAF